MRQSESEAPVTPPGVCFRASERSFVVAVSTEDAANARRMTIVVHSQISSSLGRLARPTMLGGRGE